MKIQFLVSLSGPGQSYDPGDIADVDNEEAARLISASIAIPVAIQPVKETRKKG